jgi:hypothetical protein
MFIQVIRGKVKDAEQMRAANESWHRELQPGAKGYLGSTMGVADDGTFIGIARFESEDAARTNSDRPEQGQWWEETSKLFDGEPTFYDCPGVDVFQGGGSDDAKFVQVMIYKPKDVAEDKALAPEFEKISPMRPDILGGTSAYATDGTVIGTNYFTSEAEARAGEKGMMTPEVQQLMDRFGANAGEVTFIDLKDPWLS